MSRFALWVLLAAAFAAGCKKQAPAPSATLAPPDQAASAAAAPASPRGPGQAPYAPTPAVVAANDDINTTLHQLSLELRKYVVRSRSVPRNFEEFVAKSHLQVPPAPAGKKYAIQGQAVVLTKL
jgi:hypothetical protein